MDIFSGIFIVLVGIIAKLFHDKKKAENKVREAAIEGEKAVVTETARKLQELENKSKKRRQRVTKDFTEWNNNRPKFSGTSRGKQDGE